MLKQSPPDPFTHVAHKIGADSRLEQVLRALARQVQIDIKNAEFALPRSEARADLSRLKKETKRFEVALNRVSRWVLYYPPDFVDALLSGRDAIGNLEEMYDSVLSRIPAKGGRPEEPGRVICATIVLEAWAFVHGRQPGANNERLQKLCDEYWCACGCNSLDDPGSWRRTIGSALRRQDALRRSIQSEIRGTK